MVGNKGTSEEPQKVPLRIGIVGCGAIAEAMHIPAAKAAREVSLRALVDADLGRACKLAETHEIQRAAASISQVREDVDAVILATPPHVRPRLAFEAFSLGLHVLAEKPLANTVADCEAMTEASKRAGLTLAVAHVYRFYPARAEIAKMINAGELGPVRSVVVTQGKPYSWNAVTGYTVQSELVPGGVLINAGIHPLDTLIWWLGDPSIERYEDDAIGGLESNVRMCLRFPGGAEARLRQSRTCNLPTLLRVCAEGGDIEVSPYSVSAFDVVRDGVRHTIEAACGMTHAGAEVEQIRDFAKAVSSGASPLVDGSEGTRVIRVIEACYTMKRTRPWPSRVPLPGVTW